MNTCTSELHRVAPPFAVIDPRAQVMDDEAFQTTACRRLHAA